MPARLNMAIPCIIGMFFCLIMKNTGVMCRRLIVGRWMLLVALLLLYMDDSTF